MITLKDLGVGLYPVLNCTCVNIFTANPEGIECTCGAKKTQDSINKFLEKDLAKSLRKAGYVKLEEEMLTDKILKRKNIKSEYQQVSILVARWAIQEIIIDNLKSLLKVAK